jgi:hypothetical protein
MNARTLAACLTVAIACASIAAQEVRIALPSPLGNALADAIRDAAQVADGDAVTFRVVEERELAAGDAQRATLLIASGPTLLAAQRRTVCADLGAVSGIAPTLRMSRDGRAALPWSMSYVACGAIDAIAPSGSPASSWESLALAYAVGDRMCIVDPVADRGPWLLAMHETMQKGGGESAVYGVWTAMDARIGAFAVDYESMLRRLVAEPSMLAVLPTSMAAADPRSAPMQTRPLSYALPIGLAVRDGDGRDAAIALLAKILEPRAEASIRERMAFLIASAGDVDVPADAIEPAFTHFAQRIQGQGRRVERIADWIDYVSFGLLACALFAFWIRQRRGEPK